MKNTTLISWLCLLSSLFTSVQAQEVTSLSFINADTDAPIATFDPLTEGAVIDIADVGTANFSIRANTSGTPDQVQFNLDNGTHTQSEGVAPYALFGDTNGDYAPGAALNVNTHTITATAYTGGVPGTPLTINFEIINSGGGSTGGSNSNASTWIEENGILIMEAEKGTPETTDTWTTETSVSDYRGDGYLIWNNQNYFSDMTHGIVAYRIFINNPGSYKLRLRAFHDPASHGQTPDQENDCWTNYETDNAASMYKSFRDQSTAGQPWTFNTTWEPTHGSFSEPVLNLTAGEHVFRIAARSQYFMIDRIYLVQDTADLNPDLPESQVITGPLDGDGSVTISGELKRWHKVTLDLAGPGCNETDSPNPFTDYRMQVTFTNGSSTYSVPGYFAADGNAAETSAEEGNIWRAHLSPDLTGTWNYTISFTEGSNVAVNGGGTPVAPYDGITGTFTIAETDKTAPDHRALGRLEYVGERYLRYSGSEDYFIKVGADAPETFLGYADFDNTSTAKTPVKTWSPHIADWNPGDPVWKGDRGKGMIGAINYLAEKGMNVFSFLTYNAGGDGKNVWPYRATNHSDLSNGANRLQMDCSKLDQWGIVFDYASSLGMYLHFKTQERENDAHGTWGLDAGNLGPQRKLYYRELIARFGHNQALNWNLGEENTQSTQQQQDMAQYFYDNDPYNSHVVLHTWPGDQEQIYRPLIGNLSKLTGVSIQTGWNNVHSETLQWLNESAAAGKIWVAANDEQGGANDGIPPDPGWPGYGGGGASRDDLRHQTLWGNLMAGGAGVEAYFGYSHPENDLNCEDFRSRDGWWDMCRHAKAFFDQHIPFWRMSSADALVGNSSSSTSGDYCLAEDGQTYVAYFQNASSESIDLSGVSGTFNLRWYDPRNGGTLQTGSVTQVTGGSSVSLGTPPNNATSDWVALLTNTQATMTLDSVLPATGDYGETVTLGGTNLSGVTTVSFNGTPASFTITNANTIQATVPTGATSGTISISDGSTTINGPTFTLQGFTYWMESGHGTASDKTRLGDPDSDGLNNLMEYALDSNPEVSSPDNAPTVSLNGDSVEFRFMRARSQLNYYVQSNPEITTSSWSDIATNPGNSGGYATVSVPKTDFVNGKLFMRLRVSE